MKRIVKTRSKRGFTLLEVMLATLIMSIVSTMIMRGFLSTMNYAHNNNVYSKMGAKNYHRALNKITIYLEKGKDNGLQDRILELKNAGTADSITYNVTSGSGAITGREVVVRTFSETNNTGINITAGLSEEYVKQEASVVGNRHSFFFQPTIVTCPVDDSHPVRYCVVPRTGAGGWYCVASGCTYTDEIHAS